MCSQLGISVIGWRVTWADLQSDHGKHHTICLRWEMFGVFEIIFLDYPLDIPEKKVEGPEVRNVPT